MQQLYELGIGPKIIDTDMKTYRIEEFLDNCVVMEREMMLSDAVYPKVIKNFCSLNAFGDFKFYFDYVTSNTISNNTRLVTSNTYSLVPDDYYVGINYAGPTTITLQPTAQNGKVVVIKDESGNCSINPITVTGNVDNDSGGFILKINNGAIQMIYRNGWRII